MKRIRSIQCGTSLRLSQAQDAGPRGVITINGNTERSLRTEEHTTALAAEIQCGLFQLNLSSAAKLPDTVKQV